MPVNCLEQSITNNNTETQSTQTMMIPNNVSYQSPSSSSSTSYFNDEIKSSNNSGQSSQHSVVHSFDSDHHYLTIKSTTAATRTSTSSSTSSFDDHNGGGGDCTTLLSLTNQEKSLLLNNNNNNNVTECYTMLDGGGGGGGGEDLPPPLLSLPIIPSYHHNNHHHNHHNHHQHHHHQQQYPPQQIQLNITIGPGTGVQSRTFPIIYDQEQIPKNVFGTYLEIIEQPTNRIRYRYRSEKGSHGGLNGANSSQIKKTYPTIKIENYHHPNPVYIRASLATNHDDNPRSHVHKLMGRHCSEDGSCTLAITENMTAIFQNLGILFIGKKEVPEILFKRKLLEYRTATTTTTGYSLQGATFDQREKLEERLREESEKEAKDLNLNSVRLCFEAFMLHNDALYPICPLVYSRPIANQKSPDSGELKIVRISRFCGSVTGGDEIYLLCEKVNKKEIRVRFFEINDQDGSQQWEAYGDFNESDVHHQVAIVFRTPPYRKQTITKPCQVFMQLYRQRDGEYSEPRTFIYKPKTPAAIKDPTNRTDMVVINHDGDHDGTDSMNDPEEEEMIINHNHNNGVGIMMSNGNGGVAMGGLQECVLNRLRMENMPPGFKRKKYVARNPHPQHHLNNYQQEHKPSPNHAHHPDPMLHHNGGGKHSGSSADTSNSNANSLSSDCSSPSCLSSSSPSSSTSSSPTSIVFSKNTTGIGYHHDATNHGIIIKKEFENEINLISYSSPPPPPSSSNYPDPCSMDIPSINSSSIVPKHSNLAHDDYEQLNPMWTTTTTAPATAPSEPPMPMIVVNDFCCGQTNQNHDQNHNHDHNHHNDHQNIYLNGNINISNVDCIHFPMMMNNIMPQSSSTLSSSLSSTSSSSSPSSLMATVTAATATTITSPPGSYANHHHHHQIYAVAAADDDGHTGGNNIVSSLYSL